MGKQTIIESIKEWLAGICWHLFLWLNNLTEDEYFRQIKEQELRTDDSRPLEKLAMPKITDIIEECAKIAETYEPDEKLDYVTYASRDIRELKLKYKQ